MALNTITSGVSTNFSTELNENFQSLNIKQLYTGSGFDVVLDDVTSSGTTSSSVELDSLASSDIGSADYVMIDLTVQYENQLIRDGGDTSSGTPRLQVEIKEVGGSYSDILPQTSITSTSANMDYARTITGLKTITCAHALTSGMKNNGFQIRVTGAVSISYNSFAGAPDGSITNKFTVVRLG